MPSSRTCPSCGGPDDPLHTPQECRALVALDQYDELDRYDLSVVGAVITRAGGGIASAIALHQLGWLKGRRSS